MYQALYRKYRPKTFEDVVGQKVIIKTLTNSILNEKINHAYLFTGPRGTGKTSISKILAKIVNCECLNGITPCNKCVSCTQTNNKQNTDIIEIDAASNNGVDEIRELRDKVSLVPSYGKYKVYIIDEVHMLTTAAFNALLKTLEEPPKHIIFILATTEPHKIPLTILSRCQRFDFKKISVDDITERLNQVCEKENINIEQDAIKLIAQLSDGGMRDSLSLLDQLTAYTLDKITINDVHDVYGTITNTEISNLITKICKNEIKDVFDIIDKYDNSGKNLSKIIENIIIFLKNVLIFENCSDFFTENEKKLYLDVANLISENKLYQIIDIFLDTVKSTKNASNIRLSLELAIIKIIELDKNNQEEIKVEPQIEVIEQRKKIESKPIHNELKITDEIKSKLNELKKIRINNTLAFFEKKELIDFKNQIDKIQNLLMNPDCSSTVSLILDGDIRAKGKENIIFVYKLENLEECFNASLLKIEKILNDTFNETLKPIAVSSLEWEKIKLEYNNSKKDKSKEYKPIEEKLSINDIFNKEDTIQTQETNDIEEIFDDLIEYN